MSNFGHRLLAEHLSPSTDDVAPEPSASSIRRAKKVSGTYGGRKEFMQSFLKSLKSDKQEASGTEQSSKKKKKKKKTKKKQKKLVGAA